MVFEFLSRTNLPKTLNPANCKSDIDSKDAEKNLKM